jgi:hypothetical protein
MIRRMSPSDTVTSANRCVILRAAMCASDGLRSAQVRRAAQLVYAFDAAGEVSWLRDCKRRGAVGRGSDGKIRN